MQIVVLERSGPPHAPLQDYESAPGVAAIRREDFATGSTLTASETANQPVGHRALRREGRQLEVFVTLGAAPVSDAQIDEANRVLTTLRVDAVPAATGRVQPPRFLAADGWHLSDSGSDFASRATTRMPSPPPLRWVCCTVGWHLSWLAPVGVAGEDVHHAEALSE